MNAEKFMNKVEESEWLLEDPETEDCVFTKREVINFAELYHKWKMKQLGIVEDLTKGDE